MSKQQKISVSFVNERAGMATYGLTMANKEYAKCFKTDSKFRQHDVHVVSANDKFAYILGHKDMAKNDVNSSDDVWIPTTQADIVWAYVTGGEGDKYRNKTLGMLKTHLNRTQSYLVVERASLIPGESEMIEAVAPKGGGAVTFTINSHACGSPSQRRRYVTIISKNLKAFPIPLTILGFKPSFAAIRKAMAVIKSRPVKKLSEGGLSARSRKAVELILKQRQRSGTDDGLHVLAVSRGRAVTNMPDEPHPALNYKGSHSYVYNGGYRHARASDYLTLLGATHIQLTGSVEETRKQVADCSDPFVVKCVLLGLAGF